MKLTKLLLGLTVLASLVSCEDYLDREVETNYKEQEVFVNYERMRDAGFGVYAFLFNRIGFNRIDNAMLASASDEADHADINSSIQLFNKGAWTAVSNPDDVWSHFYQGIRRADLFLENSVNYKQIVYRDTLIQSNKDKYYEDIRDIAWLRAETRFLRAYYYFELIKRYGGVPIMEKTNYTNDEMKALKRKTFDECAEFVAAECDSVLPHLRDTWVGFD